MVAAGRAGYLPIGVDIKIDALQAARRVMAFHNVAGFVVSADLAALPFQSGLLDSVFSYSVLQHAHRDKVRDCVAEIHRVLANDGACFLEFPLSHGLSNWRHSLKRSQRAAEDDPESWVVRYYSWTDLEHLFQPHFPHITMMVDCILGIGLRPEDSDLLPWKYRPLIFASELFKRLSEIVKPLGKLSDSIFVEASKSGRALTRTVAIGSELLTGCRTT